MDHVCTAKSGDGTPIAYRRMGEGPPVILVGGALNTAESQAPLAKLLAPVFEVLIYDRRGRGASGDTAPYAVEREIEDLAALIVEAGGSASVYGISSGAALVLEAAAAGLTVTQLAVYEPPYATGPADLAEYATYAERLSELLARGQRAEAVELFMSVVGVAPEMIAGIRRSPMWPDLTALAETLAYDNAVLGPGLVPAERLKSIRTRAVVVDGGCSPVLLRNAARSVAKALPRGRHRTLTGQTHDVAPHVLAPVLKEFFAA
ncbi:alpha/beta fold hydrolase [Streptomyces sp. NPDC059568]|uniref:alpha/beta fold hydrolase n=1 Tax=Streptomyces sp. NPDC059568 TaxID=3346868 RepID=UPI003682AFFC